MLLYLIGETVAGTISSWVHLSLTPGQREEGDGGRWGSSTCEEGTELHLGSLLDMGQFLEANGNG